VSKWKCTICWRQVVTEKKPNLIERLCPDCKVSHWKKVVDIYKTGDAERHEEAKKKLSAAIKALKKTQEVK
jgi:DNA-directed RNA polymerase subunit RPC12/RpoP